MIKNIISKKKKMIKNKYIISDFALENIKEKTMVLANMVKKNYNKSVKGTKDIYSNLL